VTSALRLLDVRHFVICDFYWSHFDSLQGSVVSIG